jgi:hypothetical protein
MITLSTNDVNRMHTRVSGFLFNKVII